MILLKGHHGIWGDNRCFRVPRHLFSLQWHGLLIDFMLPPPHFLLTIEAKYTYLFQSCKAICQLDATVRK